MHRSVDPGSESARSRSDPEAETVELAYTSILGTDADDAYLTLGRNVETGEIEIAGLEFVTTEPTDPDDVPFDFDGDGSRAELPVKAELVDASADEIRSETLELDDISNPGYGLDDNQVRATDIRTASACGNCRFLVSQLCFYGCGAPIWILCGFLAVPTGGVGGLACGAFVYGACGFIALYGCDHRNVNTLVCKELNQC